TKTQIGRALGFADANPVRNALYVMTKQRIIVQEHDRAAKISKTIYRLSVQVAERLQKGEVISLD
ncbi:unnamed protein product, partial [marine sediment metagenome]